MPNPFPPNHYERLEEYSPFVKSLESGKLMEKSPELIIVGYGRVRGEDHVIVQQKDNSEKREKIGARWGSTAFPYRLLSITNASNRRSFKAILEDRNGRRREIGYASETQTVAPGAGSVASTNPALPGNPTSGLGSSAGLPTNFIGRPAIFPPQPLTVEEVENRILELTAKINDPATTDIAKKIFQNQLEAQKKRLEKLSNPTDLPAAEELAPQAAP